MQRDRRQDGISADKTADANADRPRRRLYPAPLLGFRQFWQTADGVRIQTADKAQGPLYAKGESKRRSSFFFSLYTYNPHDYRAITADSTRPRFDPGLFWNPAVRVRP